MNSDYTIVFDLDNTICIPNLSEDNVFLRYGHAVPIHSVIDRMKILHEKGYKIIIHTSRGMLSTNGDIDKIKKRVGKITEYWLDRYNVPYDELIFGKPYSNTFYVDDKAMTIDQFKLWIQKKDK